MNDKAIEAAAKAICIAHGYKPSELETVGRLSGLPLWKDHKGCAEAAIAAYEATQWSAGEPLYTASPNAGEVTEEELEKAAAAVYAFCRDQPEVGGPPFSELNAEEKAFALGLARAALASLGIKVGG